MDAVDFEYDGIRLSSFGLALCRFDSDGGETVSNGSSITFDSVPFMHGAHHLLASSSYDECLEATFCICKDPCKSQSGEVEPLSPDEISKISRWLSRRDYHALRIFQDGYGHLYFNGSFKSINRVTRGGDVVGLELTFVSDRPFALCDLEPVDFRIDKAGGRKTVADASDEIGYSYPSVFCISCRNAEKADLSVRAELIDDTGNVLKTRETVVKGCSGGESVTFRHPAVSSTDAEHKVQDDFNFVFPRLENAPGARNNRFTFSIPCEVHIEYTPVRKVGI